MSRRSSPTPGAEDGGGSHGTIATRLGGKVNLLVPSGVPGGPASVKVHLDAGNVEAGLRTGPAPVGAPAVPAGSWRWGWRDGVGSTSNQAGVEVRRLGVVDERGVALVDVPDDVAALVMPLLDTDPPADVGAMLSELVGFVSSLAGLDALVHGVDYSDALCPPDRPSLDDAATASREPQTDHPGTSLPATDEIGHTCDQLWAGTLDYGSSDVAPGSDVWSCRE